MLNVSLREASLASRSSTLAELNLTEANDYVARTVDGHDVLIPVELLDRYLSLIESAAPGLPIP